MTLFEDLFNCPLRVDCRKGQGRGKEGKTHIHADVEVEACTITSIQFPVATGKDGQLYAASGIHSNHAQLVCAPVAELIYSFLLVPKYIKG
jgi:hypothetical protein